jgi:DNA-binding NarL/FixJ family response regulator
MSVRILIADDQPLVRAGLRKILSVDAAIEVVAEAEDGLGAVEAVQRTAPDVAVLDIRMPVLDGLEATRRITASHAQTRVLVLTTFGLDEYVVDALRGGASGFLLKDARPEELIAAVKTIAAGEALLSPAVTRAVIERFAALADPPAELRDRLDELTAREREVLGLIAAGLSNREIAAELVVGEGTVKSHVLRILRKLGLRDRVHVGIFGYEVGLTRPGEPTTLDRL